MTLPLPVILAHAATDRALDHPSVRVLVYLSVRLDDERFTPVIAREPACALGIRREVAARRERAERACGYLEEGPEPHRGRSYRIRATLRCSSSPSARCPGRGWRICALADRVPKKFGLKIEFPRHPVLAS